MNKNLGDANLEESLRCHSPHDFAKWLEYYGYKNHDNPIPSTKILSTHMPYSALPGLIKDSTTLIVYVSRDPKDNVVSLWHFLNKMKGRDTPGIELDKVFYSFCNGVSHYGPFWDHTLSYWHASLESPHKVLFLRYEDMIASPVIHISRLANFIGHPFTIEEEKMGLKERIIDICSFDKLTSYAANQSTKSNPSRLPYQYQTPCSSAQAKLATHAIISAQK
ncbi:unnamed protein product [Cuscuta epithymum]|uniref:Sulfotransferase n=1 Tax=Cuscuta epithymum TaxID=186058 RepID=A0AAV0G9C1_9ASTE|nr:unnamed protein product [Cuscuta epithymum]